MINVILINMILINMIQTDVACEGHFVVYCF